MNTAATTSIDADRLTREIQAAIGHIHAGERTDARQIVRNLLEDYQPTGHTGSWVRVASGLLAHPDWGDHYDLGGATRALQVALEYDDIAGDMAATTYTRHPSSERHVVSED